jgi:hypothetical protein
MYVEFPCSEFSLNRAMVNHELIDFGKRWLGSDDVHIRTGVQLARYPGYRGGVVGGGSAHFDNGNNSLLPRPKEQEAYTLEHRHFGQLGFWTHLEEVKEGQAPLQMIRRADNNDMSKAVQLICPAGTVCVFPRYTWHSAGSYTLDHGQRFTWGFGLGRADHFFEGFKHYTSAGRNPHFIELIQSLSPDERTLFRFPKVGHQCYTGPMLEALEEQYPGWDATGEYARVGSGGSGAPLARL